MCDKEVVLCKSELEKVFELRGEELWRKEYVAKDGDFIKEKLVEDTGYNRGYTLLHFQNSEGFRVNTTYHRVKFCLAFGDLYKGDYIDHINGVENGSLLVNMRLSDPRENSQNTKVHREGKILGINQVGNKFVASIRIEGISINLGTYVKEEDAHSIYIEACNRVDEFTDYYQFKELLGIKIPEAKGFKVSQYKGENRFIVTVGFKGGYAYVGSYKTEEEAVKEYRKAVAIIEKFEGSLEEFKDIFYRKAKFFNFDKAKGKFSVIIPIYVNDKRERCFLKYTETPEEASMLVEEALSRVNEYVDNAQFRALLGINEDYIGKGVRKRGNKWESYICINSEFIYLKSFESQKEAHEFYLKAYSIKEMFKGDKKKFKELLSIL